MFVRTKFVVEEIKLTANGGTLTLIPVTNGSAENAKFFKYTPWGKVEVGTINREALNEFEPGVEFYVDFTRAS